MPPKKATAGQYKTLIDLIADCDCIRWGKGTADMKRQAWKTITKSLNSLGGVEKTPEGWKKAFIEMKSHIKSKIRGLKPLSDTGKKCAEISGLYTSCSGMAEIPELVELGTTEKFIVELDGSLTQEDPEDEPVTEILPEIVEIEEPQPQAVAGQITEEIHKKTGTKKKPSKSMQSIIKKQKTAQEQYEMYIHFKTLKCTNEEEAFEKLCIQLNKENSPNRSLANWKRVFSEWEARIKAKARRIHYEQEVTGGGILVIEVLTNLEKKLLEVISKILIYGHPLIIELGIQKKALRTCTYKTRKASKDRKRRNSLNNSIKLNKNLQMNLNSFTDSLNALQNSFSLLNDALINLSNVFK